MPSSKTDILSQLSDLSWRGLVVPCMANSVKFEHAQAEHNQPGVDGGIVETVCRKSARMAFRIPFHTTIAWTPDLYPGLFREFWNACLDGSVGPFTHPEFGQLDARVASFSLSVDPNSRSGYDVDVEWVETIENDLTIGDNPNGPIASAASLAAEWDAMSGKISPVPTYDDGTGDDLLTALKKLQGALLLAQLSIQDLVAKVAQVTGAINGMLDSLDSATSADAWLGRSILVQIQGNLQDIADKSGAAVRKRVDFVIATADIAPRDAAAKAGMQLADFFKMNPRFGAKAVIPAGGEYFIEVG